MADPPPLPAALRIPEISRFVGRANQLRRLRPALAYWCDYHAVNQIVGRQLHSADDDCFAFTHALLERLEAAKADRADDDAIHDNDAGRAHVEAFAQETLDRAERTMRANKVTRQTADTFDAAATFFDLTREWAAPDAETLQKIKFAKWNAARILKALRQGVDPNESNPKPPEPEPEIALVPEPEPESGDPAEVELAPTAHDDTPSAYHQVSLQEVPDTGEPLPSSPPPPPANAPAGFGFPPPEPTSELPPLAAPSSISTTTTPAIAATSPPPPSLQQPPADLQPLPPTFPPATVPRPYSPPPHPPAREPVPMMPRPATTTTTTAADAHGAVGPVASAATSLPLKDLNQAQKHAKWAISALNFDDVPTAVKELRNALAMLGAQ